MQTTRSYIKSNYIREIDGLRAFAVFVVMLFHFAPESLNGGFLGVDIFFVISGFVVTKSLFTYEYTNIFSFLAIFFSRRIKRLAPALILLVAVVAMFSVFFIDRVESSLLTALAGMFGVANFYLLYTSWDYFNPVANENLFLHLWSLAVEEQFYIVYPFFVFCSSAIAIRNLRSHRKILMTSLIATSFASIYFFFTFDLEQVVFYMMPFRFWELGFGGLAFLVSYEMNSNLKLTGFTFHKFLSYSATLIILCLVFTTENFSSSATFMVCLATGILLLSFSHSLVDRFLRLKYIRFVGVISYSLYLWHWPVFVITTKFLDFEGLIILQFTLSLMFASFSYLFFEKVVLSLDQEPKTIFKKYAITLCLAGMMLFGTFGVSNDLYLGE